MTVEVTKEQLAHCREVAAAAIRSIAGRDGKYILKKWNCSTTSYTLYNNMPTLVLKVNGKQHQGWVFVSLEEGKDGYVVSLLNEDHTLKRAVVDVEKEAVRQVLMDNI